MDDKLILATPYGGGLGQDLGSYIASGNLEFRITFSN